MTNGRPRSPDRITLESIPCPTCGVPSRVSCITAAGKPLSSKLVHTARNRPGVRPYRMVVGGPVPKPPPAPELRYPCAACRVLPGQPCTPAGPFHAPRVKLATRRR